MYEGKIKRIYAVIKKITTKLEVKADSDKLSEEELLELQNEIITEFEEDIVSIGQAIVKKKRYINESKVEEYIENLKRIRTKLKSYAENLSIEEKKMNDLQKQLPNISIVNTNNNNNSNNNANNNTNDNNADIKVLFDEVRSKIEKDEYMSEEEISEVLEKINEIEKINNENEPNNKKWFKLRPTMEWLGTKGLTTATAILSLITAILKMN